MLTALIDVDVLVYCAAAAAEKTVYHLTTADGKVRTFDNAKERDAWMAEKEITKDMVSIRAEVLIESQSRALLIAERKFERIIDELKTTKWEGYISGPGNYREAIAVTKPYKGNRQVYKPHHHAAVRDYYLKRGARRVPGAEADDALGTRAGELGETACIASTDKDLVGIPGKHLNWDKNTKFTVTPDYALRTFMRQVVSGDTSDNVPGVPRWGYEKAKALVMGQPTLWTAWDAVKALYERVRGAAAWRSYLEEQGALLWIRRKRGEMWNINYFEEHYLGTKETTDGLAAPVSGGAEQRGSDEAPRGNEAVHAGGDCGDAGAGAVAVDVPRADAGRLPPGPLPVRHANRRRKRAARAVVPAPL